MTKHGAFGTNDPEATVLLEQKGNVAGVDISIICRKGEKGHENATEVWPSIHEDVWVSYSLQLPLHCVKYKMQKQVSGLPQATTPALPTPFSRCVTYCNITKRVTTSSQQAGTGRLLWRCSILLKELRKVMCKKSQLTRFQINKLLNYHFPSTIVIFAIPFNSQTSTASFYHI